MSESTEPLTEWELQLLFEEEEWRRRQGGGEEVGDREPRRPGPRSGAGAATAGEPNSEDGDGKKH